MLAVSLRSQPQAAIETFQRVAKETNSPLYFALPFEFYETTSQPVLLGIQGSHQRENGALAIAAAQLFLARTQSVESDWSPPENLESLITTPIMIQSLQNTFFPGRSQIVQWFLSTGKTLNFFMDGAHTAASLAACGQWYIDQVFRQNNTSEEPFCVLVFTLTHGRDPVPLLNSVPSKRPNGCPLFDSCIISSTEPTNKDLSPENLTQLNAVKEGYETLYSAVPQVALCVFFYYLNSFLT